MLFSHPEIAGLMNERYTAHWVKVRDVPKVTIDFGGGRVLERTLQGNIATYICLPDGRVLDVITGLNDASTYARRLREGLELYRTLTAHTIKISSRRVPLAPALLRYHEVALSRGHAEGLRAIANPTPAELEPGFYSGDLGAVERIDARAAMSKMVVELPLKRAIDPAIVERDIAHGELERVLLPEQPLRGERPRTREESARETLAADGRINEARRRQVHRLLLLAPLKTPAELAQQVYKEILHVDLSDPYLGLAPDAIGGEGGRK